MVCGFVICALLAIGTGAVVVPDASVVADTSRVTARVVLGFGPTSNTVATVLAAVVEQGITAESMRCSSQVAFTSACTFHRASSNATGTSNASGTDVGSIASAYSLTLDDPVSVRLRLERSIAKDIGLILVNSVGSLDTNASAGRTVNVRSWANAVWQTSSGGETAIFIEAAVDIDTSALPEPAAAAAAVIGFLRSLQSAEISLVRESGGLSRLANGSLSSAPHSTAWAASALSEAAVSLEHIADVPSETALAVRAAAVQWSSNVSSTEAGFDAVARIAAAGNVTYAQRLMRQVYFLDGRDGTGPAWAAADIIAVQAAVMADIAEHLGVAVFAADVPTASELTGSATKRDTGATPSARVLGTVRWFARDAVLLNDGVSRLSGRRIALQRASAALRLRLGVARDAPVEVLFLRTATEQALADLSGTAPPSPTSTGACRNLGCWVPVVLWCVFVAVVAMVVAVATTGRAATIEDDDDDSSAASEAVPAEAPSHDPTANSRSVPTALQAAATMNGDQSPHTFARTSRRQETLASEPYATPGRVARRQNVPHPQARPLQQGRSRQRHADADFGPLATSESEAMPTHERVAGKRR